MCTHDVYMWCVRCDGEAAVVEAQVRHWNPTMICCMAGTLPIGVGTTTPLRTGERPPGLATPKAAPRKYDWSRPLGFRPFVPRRHTFVYGCRSAPRGEYTHKLGTPDTSARTG